jgi:hypothetical protein
MAAHQGVSKATVQRLWARNDLKPHLTKVFKLSSDPDFEAKFWDVIGLYLDPPERALVLCCDEKTQIQALQRSQPGLPLGLGHLRTETHDYYRHGTVTLFAALDYLEGKVLARTAPKHTHRQWLEFLKQIERETPPELDLHLVLDNYATRKHPRVKQWLAQRPRFHLHFVPTSSSWREPGRALFPGLKPTGDSARQFRQRPGVGRCAPSVPGSSQPATQTLRVARRGRGRAGQDSARLGGRPELEFGHFR